MVVAVRDEDGPPVRGHRDAQGVLEQNLLPPPVLVAESARAGSRRGGRPLDRRGPRAVVAAGAGGREEVSWRGRIGTPPEEVVGDAGIPSCEKLPCAPHGQKSRHRGAPPERKGSAGRPPPIARQSAPLPPAPPNVSVSISRTDELSLSATKRRLPLASSDSPLGCAQLVRFPFGPFAFLSYPAAAVGGAGLQALLFRVVMRQDVSQTRPRSSPFPLTIAVAPDAASYRQIWCCPAIATNTSPFAATTTSHGELRSCRAPDPPPR